MRNIFAPSRYIFNLTLSKNKYITKTKTNLKHAVRMEYNKDRYYHTKELFRSCNVLNVYILNLLNASIFMYKIKTGTGLAGFHRTFKMPSHSYPTRFSSVNYSKPKTRLHKSRFWISIRGPTYGTILLVIQRKNLNLALFLNQK